MHLIEVWLPSAAASFLGYGKEKVFFIKCGGKKTPPIKTNPNSLNVRIFLGGRAEEDVFWGSLLAFSFVIHWL